MAPPHPPFPTARNLPFQPDAGIQTSILMSESLVGLSVAATRQNAGKSLNGSLCAAPRPPGAWGITNEPAATDSASEIVVLGSACALRLSHERPAANAGWWLSRTNEMAPDANRRTLIIVLSPTRAQIAYASPTVIAA